MFIKLDHGGAVSSSQINHRPEPSPRPPIARPKNSEPLLRETVENAPLPVEHLGALKGPTQAVADLTAAPIEIAFQSILAMSALAVQHHVNVETIAGTTPTNLFMITVAASGERKSSCDKLATAAAHAWEEEHYPSYLTALQAYEVDQSVYHSEMRQAVKSRLDNVADAALPERPLAPVLPRKILSDMTVEGLCRHFDDGDPSIGIFADEGGQFFGGYGMSRDQPLKTSAWLSKLLDGAPINRTRAGSTQATYRNRRGSLHMMIQPGIAENVFGSDVLRDQGLLSRMLIASPPSRIGHRFIELSDLQAEKRAASEAVLKAFEERMGHLLRSSPQGHESSLEVHPRCLPLSPDARALLVNFGNHIEAAQRPGGNLATITGFASKAAEQAARIAGILTIIGDETYEEVSPETMRDALRIMGWYVAEAQRLLDTGTIDPTVKLAQDLLNWLHARYADAPFAKRDIVRLGPSKARDAKTVDSLLTFLQAQGRIQQKQSDTKATRWELVHDA